MQSDLLHISEHEPNDLDDLMAHADKIHKECYLITMVSTYGIKYL